MLNEYFYSYLICIFLMGINFNIYPVVCISEGGNVRQALLIKSIAPILSMAIFLIYVFVTKNIKALYIIPLITFFCYAIYVFCFCKDFARKYYFGNKISANHQVSHNVSRANMSWSAGYILTQGFPILLPFVLSPDDAAKLILTANLLNAFLAFICIGATIVGPRIPKMIENGSKEYKNIILKNLIFIYLFLTLCLVFFDELLSIFYIFFSYEKFLDRDFMFIFTYFNVAPMKFFVFSFPEQYTTIL